MNIAKHTILTLLVLATALFTACSDEEAVAMPDTEMGEGLHIALSLGGKQPVYAAKQTRANTIEGENSLNENTVKTVDFFLFSPEMETVNDVKQVKLDTNGDTVWVRKHYGRHTVSSQTMTDDDTNDESPDANGNAVTPDYYPTEYFTIASGSSTTWIETLGLVPGSRLYALANVDWSKATLPEERADGTITYKAATADNITTIDQLKSLAVLDTDIYKKEKADESTDETVSETTDTQEMTDKLFLMDGCYRFTQADITTYTGTPNAVHKVTVDLRRAAAKVRVNIYKATSWKDSEGNTVSITTDNIVAKVSNYATTTKVVTPEDGESLGDNGHVSTYAELGTYDRELTAPSGKAYLRSVLFYTFAHDWSADVGHETTFIMNLPYTGRDNNWYKIVFVPDGGQRYNRNTFYEVDVTVAYDGSEDSYEPSPISNPKYKVSEWYPEEFSVENTTPVDYLILDKYFIDMRNVAETQITFYSSNKVTVEVVHDVADEIASLGGKDKFPWPEGFDYDDYIGEDNDSRELKELNTTVATIPGIYYPDKENHRVPIYHDAEKGVDKNTTNSTADTYFGLTGYTDDGLGVYDSEASDGSKKFSDLNKAKYLPVTVKPYEDMNSQYDEQKEQSEVYITWPGDEYGQDGRLIDLYSAIPRNATLRFITLKVRMKKLYIEEDAAEEDKYITRYVIIKQYPLVYVVNQFGLYSIMDGAVLGRRSLTSQDQYIIDFASEEYHTGKKSGGLFQLYCDDMEDWKGVSKWVTVPDEIIYGTYNGSAVKVYGTGETTFKHIPLTINITKDEKGNETSRDTTRGTQTVKSYSLTGNVSKNPNMKCKFYLDGTSKTFYDSDYAWGQHRYNDVGTIHHGQIYQINSRYSDGTSDDENDNHVGVDGNASAYNNRMYEVRITATSSQYRIGYPKTLTWIDENGNTQIYADPSEQNNKLVSPHFVFASQLGNASATPFWEMAQDHCMHYVEVDNKGNVYKDWRLPTIAELSTIKQFQQDENIFNVTMSRILNSDGETNPCYWTAGQSSDGLGFYVDTQGAGEDTKITALSSDNSQKVMFGIYGPYLYNLDGSYQTDDAGTKIANPNHKDAAKRSDKDIRIRCVRDIKGE